MDAQLDEQNDSAQCHATRTVHYRLQMKGRVHYSLLQLTCSLELTRLAVILLQISTSNCSKDYRDKVVATAPRGLLRGFVC